MEGVTGRSLSDVLPPPRPAQSCPTQFGVSTFPEKLRQGRDPSFTPREDTPIRAGTGARGEGGMLRGCPGRPTKEKWGKMGRPGGMGGHGGKRWGGVPPPENRAEKSGAGTGGLLNVWVLPRGDPGRGCRGKFAPVRFPDDRGGEFAPDSFIIPELIRGHIFYAGIRSFPDKYLRR